MTITELIYKHTGQDRVFEDRFGLLAAKEALNTITPAELDELERMNIERDDQRLPEMDSDNLRAFAIELLELIYDECDVERAVEKALNKLKAKSNG